MAFMFKFGVKDINKYKRHTKPDYMNWLPANVLHVIHCSNYHLPTLAELYTKRSLRVANTETFPLQTSVIHMSPQLFFHRIFIIYIYRGSEI